MSVFALDSSLGVMCPCSTICPPQQVRAINCKLEYMTDSKGFCQPVYVFTLSDDRVIANDKM